MSDLMRKIPKNQLLAYPVNSAGIESESLIVINNNLSKSNVFVGIL